MYTKKSTNPESGQSSKESQRFLSSVLPGYPQSCVADFEKFLAGTNPKCPDTTTPIFHFPIAPKRYPIKPPTVGYKWDEMKPTKMDDIVPYYSSMTPKDPSGMYIQANPWTAYPYGVPVIEETTD